MLTGNRPPVSMDFKQFLLVTVLARASGVFGDVSRDFPNIAENKRVYASSFYNERLNPKNIVDGSENTFFETRNGRGEYFVLDLGLPSTIMGVGVKEKLWFRAGPFNVLIGNSYVNADSLKSYRICAEVRSEYKQDHTLACNGFGRFLTIQKKGNVRESLKYFNVKELKVYGHTEVGGNYEVPDMTDMSRGSTIFGTNPSRVKQFWRMNDGKWETHDAFTTSYDHLVVVLKQTVSNPTVIVYRHNGERIFNFKVKIGRYWLPCKRENLSAVKPCANVTEKTGDIPCMGAARFVALDFNGTNVKISKIQVFSSKQSIPSVPLKPYEKTCEMSDKSLAHNKPAYMLSTSKNVQYFEFTDGKVDKNKKVPGTIRPWIVIDLKSTVEFEIIRLFGLEGSAVATGVDVVLGADWLPCRSEKMDSFITCGTIWKAEYFNEIRCPNYKGRFVGLRSRGNGHLYLKEFEVLSSQPSQPIVARTDDEWRSLFCNFNLIKRYNVAAGKKVWVSATHDKASFLTDNNFETCIHTGYNGWIVIDLKRVYEIQAVSFHGIHHWWRKATKNIEIRVLKYFDPCRPEFKLGMSCTTVPDGMDPWPFVVDCSARGQFVALRKTTDDREKLNLCEIMVVGTPQDHLRAFAPIQPPDIKNTIARPNMELRSSLMAGVTTAHIPRYAMRILVAPQSATPLLVKPSSRYCVLAAASVGSGRVIVAGEKAFLGQIESHNGLFWSRLRDWLAKGARPHFHKANEVVSSSPFETPGGIILWTVYYKASSSSTALIMQLLRSGKASVVVADRAHNVSPFFAPYQEVLDETGIQLFDQFANEGPTDWTTTGFDDYNIVSLQQQLDYALASTNYYLTHGIDLFKDINQLSTTILQRIHAKSKLSRLIDIYEPYMNSIEPCVRRPVTTSQEKLYNTVFAKLMVSRGLVNTNRPVATAKLFPGYPGQSAVEETVKVKVVATQADEAHSIGLYLPPGKTLRIKVLSEKTEATSWYVRIGCHTDDIHKRPSWSRYRTIVSDQSPVLLGEFFSGFGGVVWIVNSKSNTEISLEFSGAIRSPYFNLRDPKNMGEWDTARHYEAPWTEIAGDKFVFCVPSWSIRKYDRRYLADIMTNTWDVAVKGNFWLILNGWKDRKRERMTVDVEISAGWGHSGYPIYAYIAWVPEMVDKNHINLKGAWGMSHELGHNLQNQRWTFKAVGEVTNNILSLFDIYLWGHNFFNFDDKSLNQIRTHLNSGATYQSWASNAYLALRVYQQTAYHFGWDAYNAVFLKYNTQDIKPTSDQDKRDTWMTVWSDQVNLNLCPMYEFWGFSINETTKSNLKSKYDAFLPDDILTQQSPTRVTHMLTLYPGAKRTSAKVGLNPAVREKVKAFRNILMPNDVIYL